MSSEKQEEAIELLENQPTAQPFTLLRTDTNIGKQGEIRCIGQTGSAKKREHAEEYHLRMMATYLLTLENHFDTDMKEILEGTAQRAEAIKSGKGPSVKFGLELEDTW